MTDSVSSATGTRLERTRGRLKRIVTLFAVNVVLIVILDLLIGLLVARGPVPHPTPQFHRDPVAGWDVVPGSSFTVPWSEHPAGRFTIEYNSKGLRGTREYARRKPAGTARVLVLGDSHTEGSGNQDETFAARLESRLGAWTADEVEVLNGGVGRYSPYQAYLRLKHYLLEFDPDLVIATIYTGNDFLDLLRRDDRPSVAKIDDGFEERPPVYRVFSDSPSGWWASHSAAYRIYAVPYGLKYRVERALMTLGLVRSFGGGLSGGASALAGFARCDCRGIISQSLAQSYFFGRYPKVEADSMVLMEHVIDLHVELARDRGYELWVVLLPSRIQVEANLDRARLERAYASMDLDSSAMEIEDRIHEELKSRLESSGVRRIDTLPALTGASSERTPMYWYRDYHLNVDGAGIVALEIDKRLRETSTRLNERRSEDP